MGPILGSIFRFFSEIDCVILEVSVGMRAPFAPHMSFGSRAIQAKPEGASILFRAQDMKLAGTCLFCALWENFSRKFLRAKEGSQRR